MQSPDLERLVPSEEGEAVTAPRPRRRRASAAPVQLRRRRRLSRKWTAVLVILLLLVAIPGAGAAYAYNYAKAYANRLEGQIAGQFKAAQVSIDDGKAALKQATTDHDPNKVKAAKDDFTAAAGHFTAARQVVDTDPMLKRASGLPYLDKYAASRKKAVDSLADMGLALTQAASDGADIDSVLISPPPDGAQGAAKLITVLAAAAPGVAKVRLDLQRAQAAADAIDPSVIPASQRGVLTQAKTTIATGLSGLDEFDRLVPVIKEVMGANGPRTYLLLQENPAELRAGGGYPGTYSVIKVENGSIKILKTGSTYLLQGTSQPVKGERGYIAPPPTMLEFLKNIGWSLEDSNFYPSFDQNAKVATDMVQKFTPYKIDGVIAMDFYLVVDLLKVVGPITVQGKTVTADSFINQVIALGDFGNQGGPARDFVSALSGPLMDRLAALPSDHWNQMVAVLNANASFGHLQTYFTNQPAEEEMQRFGWGGQLIGTNTTDFLAEVESNFGGTKANHFLDRTFNLTLTQNGDKIHHKLVIDLVNKTPLTYPSEYRCYIRLYTPGDGSQPSITNVKADDYPNTDIPKGTKMVDGWFQINVSPRTGQGTWEGTFEWDTAATFDSSGKHQVYWRKQPGTLQDKITVTWITGDKKATAQADLLQDKLITLDSDGRLTVDVGNAGSAHLPGIGF